MSKYSSLVLLINSLSKAEQKSISIDFSEKKGSKIPDYVVLFDLMKKYKFESEEIIESEFQKIRIKINFSVAVNYLYERILSVISKLRTSQDHSYMLFEQLMKAKVLYEKSFYNECFRLLSKIQEEAIYYEDFSVLLIAQKLELQYLLAIDFADITEQDLLSKQYKINDTIKTIRRVNEHSFLYELLKYRILHKGKVRSKRHKLALNDLVVSEISIMSSFGNNNFEIQKTHKLFQSNYLINVGDYKSALNSFYELSAIFEKNKHLLSSPPIYYLMTIEGILESLRYIKNYTAMDYFISILENIETTSTHFKTQVQCVTFLYKLFPKLDNGLFEEGKKLIESYKELYDKSDSLIITRQAQLSLYTALTYFGNKEYKKAKNSMNQIFLNSKIFYSLPLFRTIRLVNLLIMYELNDFDFIEFESRSIKREIQNKDKDYKIELFILKLLKLPLNNLSKAEREKLWKKVELQLIDFRNDKFELQLLQIFDFTIWIESKIKRTTKIKNI